MPDGIVFDVSRACVDDGPGLRTVLFFKGCALRCPWCHNPEGRSGETQLALEQARCIGCGSCQSACPRPLLAGPGRWREGCRGCGACVAACPSLARRLVGRRLTAEQLVQEAATDAEFFAGTGGGVSFSGGEPLAQPVFLLECARLLRQQGIHLALETSGHWPARLAHQVARSFDLVLLDLKHVDRDRLLQVCGADAGLVLENLTTLAAHTAVEPRLTLVPGFNDSPRDLQQIAAALLQRGIQGPLTLLPFHRLARAKQQLLGCEYAFKDRAPVSSTDLAAARELLEGDGLSVAR